MKCLVAIDPGLKGGIAIRRRDGKVEAHAMPDTPRGVADILQTVGFDASAMLERVGSRPGQSSVATFTFGKGYGVLLGLLAAYNIRCHDPTPQAWMKLIPGMPAKKPVTIPDSWTPNQAEKAMADAARHHKEDRKRYLKEYAQRLYPHIKVTLMTSDALAMLSVHPEREQAASIEEEI